MEEHTSNSSLSLKVYLVRHLEFSIQILLNICKSPNQWKKKSEMVNSNPVQKLKLRSTGFSIHLSLISVVSHLQSFDLI